MAELIAGTACGFLMGSVSVVVGAFMLYQATSLFALMERLLPKGVTPTPVLAFAALAVPVLWGMIGAFLGLVYGLTGVFSPGPGLGSPNLAYTAAILVIALAAALTALVASRRLWRGFLTLCLFFAAIFGWLLPYMAS